MDAILRDMIAAVDERRSEAGRSYLEFLRRDSMSLGLYKLNRGETDEQQPHDEDEVYYVISGRGRFRTRDDDGEVGPGAVLFVEKGVEHRFYSIEEDLTLLVFFAPAEGSAREPID